MNYATFALLALCIFYKSPAIAGDDISPENTYVLAIGACPLWKHEYLDVCKHSVAAVTKAFETKFAVPKKNINIITGKKATYDGVVKGAEWLKQHTNKNSRAILYINVHGGEEVAPGDSTKKPHEMLVLWTDEKPFTQGIAIQSKQWMLSSQLRDYLDDIPSEKIVIIDACHSGAAEEDLLDHHPLIPKNNKREALIFSARTNQGAFVTEDLSMPLFTYEFTQSIMNGVQNLSTAFLESKGKTTKGAIDFCKTNPDYAKVPLKYCKQTPVKYDPHGLLEAITFSSDKDK